MTNNKLQEIFLGLKGIRGLKGAKINYIINKNIDLIEKEINLFEKAITPSEGYTKYDNERAELAKTYSKKDDKGEPVIVGKSYDIEDMDKFMAEIEKVQNKYKKEIDEREKQLANFSNFMQEESTIELYKIDMADVPNDVTTEQMNVLFYIIREDETI